MLHAHTMVYAAMFALHWEAFSRWLVDEEKDLEYMCVLSNNVQLLLDALSEEDIEKATSACADATDQLKMLSCCVSLCLVPVSSSSSACIHSSLFLVTALLFSYWFLLRFLMERLQ